MQEQLVFKGCQNVQRVPVGNDVQPRGAERVSKAKENCRLPLILDGQVWFIQPARMALYERLDRWMRPVHRVVG